MDETLWWLMSIIGPLILLVILLWLAVAAWRRRSPRGDIETARATDELYAEEERRRRAGTDGE